MEQARFYNLNFYASLHLIFFFNALLLFLVQHILATTFSQRCVIWDLRKNEAIIRLTDANARVRKIFIYYFLVQEIFIFHLYLI